MSFMKLLIAIALVLFPAMVSAGKETDAKVDALDSRMQRIERVIDNQALLGMAKKIDALQREVQELRGENEHLTHAIERLKTRQREQYLDIDRRLQTSIGVNGATSIPANNGEFANDTVNVQITNATSSSATTSSTTSADASATTSGTTVANTASNEAAQDYKNAFILLKQGKYDDSIVAFGFFLQTHPGSKYVSNAQYWLAEANYVSRRYPQALMEFSKVINTYPVSSKVADARLKLGFTHYELGQYEEARIELTRLRAQFPNSTVANLAQQRLERMSREGH